jgi:16S rRNA processing protein RimM
MPRPKDDVPDGFVAVARVLGAWGQRGELKVQPLAPEDVLAIGRTVHLADETRKITAIGPAGRFLHVRLSGLAHRDEAASHRDQYLLVPEAELQPRGDDQYYHFQLIGLRVLTTDGEDLGEITDIFATPGNDVFTVNGPRGEILIPAVDDIVLNIDLTAGRLAIELVPGLLPEPKKPT